MRLNIKDEEAYTLASEIAQLTGQRMTTVVITALRRHREQLQDQQRKETQRHELMAIAKRCAAHLQQPGSAVQHGDMLYAEQGLL
jgi:antitoxin VapB